MRFTNGLTFVGIKLHLAFMFIAVLGVLNGCSQKSNHEGAVSSDTLSAPLPTALRALAVDATNLLVEVVVDAGGVPQGCTNLTVDQVNKTFSCTITLESGAHTLDLVLSVIDASYGAVVVATTPDISVDVVPGQSTPAVITVNSNLHDDDGDGITNIAELDAGTNPFGDTCILDNSLIGNCSLG